MNVQTERLENHSIRLTVEVPQERFDRARASVIRKIGGKINIPGFRKGKVPPNMIVKYVGEAYILEEAIESLAQDIYKEALESTGIEPAAPGSMDDFTSEPEVKFTYTIPLAPEITLGDYRSFRLKYDEPETTENEVDAAMRSLQREFAKTSETDEPAAVGDRITCDLHSFFVAEDAETADGEIDVHDREEEPYIHQHGAVIDLHEGEDEPLGPGFTAQMIGARVGEKRTFRITFPSDKPNIREDVAGRTIEFVVQVHKIEKVTLPQLNDELAAQISERYGWNVLDESESPDEAAATTEAEQRADALAEPTDGDDHAESVVAQDEADTEQIEASQPPKTRPLTLAEIRERVRNNIETQKKAEVRREYANSVLEHVIETSTITFHEASVEQEINDMIEELKERLKENRLSLDLYLKTRGITYDDMREQLRPSAERRLRQGLAIRQFAEAEGLSVSQEDMYVRLQTLFPDISSENMSQLGLLNNPQFASNLVNSLMSQKIEERAIAIGRGEAPELGQAEEGPAQEPSPEVTESSTEQ